MLVRVVLLRAAGVKRDRAAVLADLGVTGELFVVDGCATLVVAGQRDRTRLRWNEFNLLVTLQRPRLGSMKLDEFVLRGYERDAHTLEPSPQAWWCRLESASPASALPPPAGAPEKSKGRVACAAIGALSPWQLALQCSG